MKKNTAVTSNLFLCSIVALDARTGKYKWHYQTVPGETWDYNSSMDIVLADVELKEGEGKRNVLFHAPKNGFFYVIDRKDGKLLSAKPFAKVTWATGIDMATGRPIEAPGARYEKEPIVVWPSLFGAHTWHAMSYNPKTGLVYIPKQELPTGWDDQKIDILNWKMPNFSIDTGVEVGLHGDIPKDTGVSSLLAWDPIKQKAVWEVPQPNYWNPGTLTTGGNLVFQGQVDGKFAAYDASSGKELWSVNVGTGISAPPMTYSINGTQYVSLLVGWGGASVSLGGGSAMAQYGWSYRGQLRQLLTFAIGGKKAIPEVGEPVVPKPLLPADYVPNDKLIDQGMHIYKSTCVWCHGAGGVSGGYAPDLRASGAFLDSEALRSIVHGGALKGNGMPQFEELTEEDLKALQQYIRSQAIKTSGDASN